MKFIIVACYGEGDSQLAWDGRRWTSDVSLALDYVTAPRARSAFRQLAKRADLDHRDRAVVVADYGLVTERVVYHLDLDGIAPAGQRRAPACAIAMGCLCAAHARGAATDAPCDARET